MKLKDFAVERYFAKYEFTAKYLLSSSDCDGFSMRYVLSLASDDEKALWDNLKLGYTETVGSEPLRQAIKQHFTTIGTNEIVVASPGEANFALMNVLLKRSDHVVCMSPSYQSLYQVAKDLGCSLSFWKPDSGQQPWYFNPDDLEKLIKPNTQLIVLNFPHNPTGFSPNLFDYQAIIDIARRHNIAVFSDEMYCFLHHNEEETLPSACDMYENAVSLWGGAKTFGLGGLRLGWLTSKNMQLLKKVESFKDYLSICNNSPSEILATIALNNMNAFVKPNLKKIKANIENFEKFQAKHADLFDFIKPNSGSTAFVKLKTKMKAMDFAENLVQKTGIMLLPSETFEYGTSHLRIGFGRENMKEVLGVFDDYLENKSNDT